MHWSMGQKMPIWKKIVIVYEYGWKQIAVERNNFFAMNARLDYETKELKCFRYLDCTMMNNL